MGAETRVTPAAARAGVVGHPTVVDVAAEAMVAAGVEVAFTFPGGGSNLALLEALRGRGVRIVLTRSEGGGALMAAALADLTGTPGVIVVGLGPGATSAINGVAHALLDRSPLILVADRYSAADAGTTGHQLIDQAAIFAPVTKAQVDLAADDVGAAVEQAMAVALAPPRGPVLIELRRDRARLTATTRGSAEASNGTAPAAVSRVGDVAAAAAAVSRARRPIVLVGEETRRDVDPGSIVALAEVLEAPVLSTYKAKGVFPESHPLAAGILTGAEIERPLLERADLLLAIGLDPVELLARPWPYRAPVVALRRTDAVDHYLDPSHTLAGEIGPMVAELRATLSECEAEWERGEAARLARVLLDPLRTGGGHLPAWRAIEVAQELAGDALVSVDAGAHMFAATWFWRSQRPNRFLISNGLATMGFAVPAAIAAAIAHPGETVLAFTGDGGFTINAAELETAARMDVKIIVLVLNDASLSLIRVKQDEIGLERSHVDFTRSDLARVAQGLGVNGAHASTEITLRAALDEALAASETTVLDVEIDGSEYAELHRLIRSGS